MLNKYHDEKCWQLLCWRQEGSRAHQFFWCWINSPTELVDKSLLWLLVCWWCVTRRWRRVSSSKIAPASPRMKIKLMLCTTKSSCQITNADQLCCRMTSAEHFWVQWWVTEGITTCEKAQTDVWMKIYDWELMSEILHLFTHCSDNHWKWSRWLRACESNHVKFVTWNTVQK